MQIGQIVKSTHGHDKNAFYMIVELSGDFVFLADGKSRRLEKAKKKNIKHIQKTNEILQVDEITGNKKLYSILSAKNRKLKETGE